MNSDTINERLHRAPFQPLTITISNGERYEVRHPEKILVGKREAVVYAPDSDRFSFVALVHVNSVKPLETATSED